MQDSDCMSLSCSDAECSDCGGSCECVTEDCIESGGDSASCGFCKVQAGDMEYDDACADCQLELDENG